MSDGAMAPVPADHPLMIAWKSYQETEDFKNTFKWATSAILISTQETAPEANRVDPAEQRERRAMGTLWGAFMAGFNVAHDIKDEAGLCVVLPEENDRLIDAIDEAMKLIWSAPTQAEAILRRVRPIPSTE